MIVAYEVEPTEDNDETEPEYTPIEHLSEPDYTLADHSRLYLSDLVHSPVYTPAGLEIFNSYYELDEDE